MTSLLASAALFENEEEQPKRRNTNRARTIKKRPSNNKNIEALMKMTEDTDDEDESGLADFVPMKPQLTRQPHQAQFDDAEMLRMKQTKPTLPGQSPSVKQDSAPASYMRAYDVPEHAQTYINASVNQQEHQTTSDINERLSYIINLLEEQRNNRTGGVTEELILYTFLGVFTIYIVDSFTRFGRTYVR